LPAIRVESAGRLKGARTRTAPPGPAVRPGDQATD
jgi:hypothetical protein